MEKIRFFMVELYGFLHFLSKPRTGASAVPGLRRSAARIPAGGFAKIPPLDYNADSLRFFLNAAPAGERNNNGEIHAFFLDAVRVAGYRVRG
jgi:hypothetical protein